MSRRSVKKIKIELDIKGNGSIDGKGFLGPECGYFIEEIEESLCEKIAQTDKPEYRQRHTTSTRNLQRGGR